MWEEYSGWLVKAICIVLCTSNFFLSLFFKAKRAERKNDEVERAGSMKKILKASFGYLLAWICGGVIFYCLENGHIGVAITAITFLIPYFMFDEMTGEEVTRSAGYILTLIGSAITFLCYEDGNEMVARIATAVLALYYMLDITC